MKLYIAEFDPNSMIQMLKILKGSVKFYTDCIPSGAWVLEAPSLHNLSEDTFQNISNWSLSDIEEFLANDATINPETKKEIQQLMPKIEDNAKS